MDKRIAVLSGAAALLLSASVASAHVVVKPNQVGIASFQTFDTSVPNEKDVATTAIRVLIPDGLNYVSPSVKPGWTIQVKKDGAGDNAKVTEIDWTGGSIPAGQRDDFTFSAQAPAMAMTLDWKAYQTYADGTIVSWDQAPSASGGDSEGTTPYSETRVVNDLAATATPKGQDTTARALSGIGIFLAAVAVGLGLKRR